MKILFLLLLALSSGCTMLPHVAHEPTFYNPFPQLSRVAVAPFVNLSTEPTVDGRQFALAYFNELQQVPGFEAVPIGVVETALRQYGLSLDSPQDLRKLALLLEVDAVVMGAITDFSPYYPPRCGLRVEWYAANPCLHPIPPGMGLPWGTPAAEQIPERLAFEADLAVTRAQLISQAPRPPASATLAPIPLPAPPVEMLPDGDLPGGTPQGQLLAHGEKQPLPLIADCQPCLESNQPVLRHTAVYNGNDRHFTDTLKTYAYFRNDARFGGWRGYLERSDDFIRYCCYLHLAETLTARGGAGETRVVWHWENDR